MSSEPAFTFGGHEWHADHDRFGYVCSRCGWSISAAGIDANVQPCPELPVPEWQPCSKLPRCSHPPSGKDAYYCLDCRRVVPEWPKEKAEQLPAPLRSVRMRFGDKSRVWKYTAPSSLTIALMESISFEVPNGSTLLDVQEQGTEQGTELAWWYYVQDVDNAQRFKKTFRLVFTGHPMGEGHVAEHVKTIQLQSVPGTVVHVFQLL